LRWHGVPPTHLVYPALEAAGVRHAFTTRHHGRLAGPSAPGGPFGAEGAGAALATVGVGASAVSFLRQVHGVEAQMVGDDGGGLAGTGDAMVTTRPGRPLAILTADCLAVVLVDPTAGLLAVAHAGWRGTVAGILGHLVERLGHLGARPDRVLAAIGPSIGPCCYEVDAPVVEPLRAAFGAASSAWLEPGAPGKWSLDLWGASEDQLTAAGIRPEAILNPRLCTACRRDLFFSYRKEGPGGRLAAVATLP
jgi:YfiH family protein